jgi:cyclophilin family peptidyl-prolyl cis-trans isomerase
MFTTALLLLLLQTQTPPSAQPPAAQSPAGPVVILDTTAGAITIQLYADKAPDSVQNFLEYVRDGFYSGTIFHRVVPGYVVQGGGYTPELVEKSTRPPVRNEATNGLTNARGTVAMARTSAVRSATSQFFINLANNARLDHRGLAPDDYGYAVFGRVIAGMDVVDRIGAVPTTSRDGMDDVPVTPIVIKSATLRMSEAK